MTTFRAWRYGPNGEAQLFENEADVPKGWKDAPKATGVDAARRELDVPPGRLDIAAIPTQLSVIASQVLAEAMAKAPQPNEMPSYVPPSATADRVGERETPKVIEDPVRGQGDRQPHIEAHNWSVADQARMLARDQKANEEAIAARNPDLGPVEPALKKLEASFEPCEVEVPTLEEVRADPSILTGDQKDALEEVQSKGIDPLADPFDHDGNGEPGGSKKRPKRT